MPIETADRLLEIEEALLIGAGASEEEAKIVARHSIDSNLAGHDSHGIIKIPTYIQRVKDGHIVPGAPSSLRVRRDDGLVDLRAENVVLALGGGAPAYPEWVCETAVERGLVRHVFEKSPEAGASVAIIGGGISAAHLALRHSRSGVKVHMVFRHDLREQSFDCHQDWMMTRDASERTGFIPERQLAFAGVESFDERRDIIRRERLAGTMPASVSLIQCTLHTILLVA